MPDNTGNSQETQYISSNELLTRANILYEFVDLFSNYEATPRNYDWNEDLSMNDVHLLARIEQLPGILSTTLASNSRRSKSLISQSIARLERGEYIIRVSEKDDSKKKMLFVTQKGKQLCEAHRRFDERNLLKTYNYLLRDCTPDEISAFYHVMQIYNNIMIAAGKKRQRLNSRRDSGSTPE